MDGNPYAVVVERGTCGMGESEVSGGGDGGAAAAGAGGGALSSHCASQYSIRLTICNSMKNANAKDSCIALAASNYQMCMQSMIQSGFPY